MKVNGTTRENNKPSPLREAVGITTGAAIGVAPGTLIIKSMVTPVSEESLEFYQLSNQFTESIDKFEKIKFYAEDIIKKTDLANKGVKIQIQTPETIKKIKTLPENSNWVLKMINNINTNNQKQVAYGLNALFMPMENIIKINNKGLYSSVFHEIGHALNFNNTKILKTLQLYRNLSLAALPAVAFVSLAIGLFSGKKHPKKDKDKPASIIDFIHNNAGKLTFLAFLPILIEEGAASIKGIKLAKPYLNPVQNQMHKNTLLKAFGNYMILPLIFAGSVSLGIFVKDKIVNHQRKKHQI